VKKESLSLSIFCGFLLAGIIPFHQVTAATKVLLHGPLVSMGRSIPKQSQGISGNVVKVTKQYAATVRLDQQMSSPVSALIWIFSGKVIPPILDRSKSNSSIRLPVAEARKIPNLLGWIGSNIDGRFQVGLKPGEYTMMVQYGEDLYANSSSADRVYPLVQVLPNKITEVELINDENLFFKNLPGLTEPSGKILPHQYQGVTGYVIKKSGNYFPPVRPDRTSAKSEPIATRVWIFSGKISRNSTQWSLNDARKHPSLLGWTMSASNGQFMVGLKPGEYTLLAEYGTELYLNRWGMDGNYSSIQVEAGQIKEIELINDKDAVS
jgi:hypothetical protein